MVRTLFLSLLGLVIISLSSYASGLSGSPITNIEIKGDHSDKLKGIIGLKKGDTYTPAKLKAAKIKIKKALESSGYYGVVVEDKIKKVGDGVAITLKVKDGEKIKIRNVKFEGNKHISSSDLEKKLVNKKGGLFSWVPIIGGGGGEAVPAQLPYDQARIKEAYMEKGYIDAQVAEPLMKVDYAKNQADITYVIKEGPQYRVGSVKIEGGAPDVDKSKLYSNLKVKSGDVFNVKKLRKDLKFIHDTFGNHGYAFNRVAPMFRKDPNNHTISLVYKIDPGKKVKVKDVIITGNKKTKDHVVRRYSYLAPGDTFRQEDYEETKKELQRTGYFDKVVVKPQRVSEDEINMVVDVDEAQTGSIAGGFGYGSYDGFSVNGRVSERNLFGTGIAASLAVELSQKSHDYSLSFKDPRVFDSLYSFSFGLYHQKNEYDYDDEDVSDYTVKRAGGWFSFGRKIGRYTHVSLGYSYNDVDYSDFDSSSKIFNDYYQSYTKSSLIGSITFDNTDDYFTPREGFYGKLNIDYAGLGGDAEFFKADLKFAAYYGLQDQIDYDLILRYKLRAGYIDDQGFTPLAEMFYMGGAKRGVRGFSSGSISPFYIDSNGHKIRVGGDRMLVNSFEASIPLDFISDTMRLTGFFDYGMLKNTIYTDKSIEKDWIKRSSVGAQIEWRSPFGPINLVFAKPLNDKPTDDKATFEFTMGSKF
jgi:outer membrane protein insertion porin family